VTGSAETIPFDMDKVSETAWIGHAKVGDLSITKSIEVDPVKYAFDVRVAVHGDDPRFVV